MAGALFGTVALSLFLAGSIFGDVAVSLFVADIAVGVSLFVAGAVFGEVWVDGRSAKCCNFQCKMRFRGGNLSLRTDGFSFAISWLEHDARIMFVSCSNRPRIVDDASAVFGTCLSYFGIYFSVAGAIYLVMLEGSNPVAPRNVNDVSYVRTITCESHVS